MSENNAPLDALPLKADQIEQHLTVHMRPGHASRRCLVCRLLVTLALETTRADQWHEEAFARGVEMDRMEREHGAVLAAAYEARETAVKDEMIAREWAERENRARLKVENQLDLWVKKYENVTNKYVSLLHSEVRS